MQYATTISALNFHETNTIEFVTGFEIGWYITYVFLGNNWKVVSEQFID